MTNIIQSFNIINMKVKYQKHEKRKNRAQAFWRQVVKEFNGGKSAQMIAQSYVNPKTGNHYTRTHIYWILKVMKEMPDQKI